MLAGRHGFISLYPVLNCLTSRTRTALRITLKADLVPRLQSVLSSFYAKRLWTEMLLYLQIYCGIYLVLPLA